MGIQIQHATVEYIRERMGADATREEALVMRTLLCSSGMGESTTQDIPDALWTAFIYQAIENCRK